MAYVRPSAGRIFGFGGKRGERNAISIGLRPVSPADFQKLKMPHENRSQWAVREKRAINRLMYGMGYHIYRVLFDVLSGAGEGGSRHGISIPNANVSAATVHFRKKSRNPDAFFDTGSLRNALNVEVPKAGRPRVVVDFSRGTGITMNGSNQRAQNAGQIAGMLEMGFTTVVTRRMQKFFIAKQLNSGTFVGVPKLGTPIVSPPRPFFKQSVDKGIENFVDRYGRGGGAAQTLIEMYFGQGGPSVQETIGPGIPGGVVGGI